MQFYEKASSPAETYRNIDPSEELPTKNVYVLGDGAIRPATPEELKQHGKVSTPSTPSANSSSETPLEVPAMNFDKPDKSKAQSGQSEETPIDNNLQHTAPIPFVAPSAETPLEMPQMNFSGQGDPANIAEEKEEDGLALPKTF